MRLGGRAPLATFGRAVERRERPSAWPGCGGFGNRHRRRQLGVHDALGRTQGACRAAVGVVVGAPLAVDQIAELPGRSGGQVQHGAPDAVAVLTQGVADCSSC